MDKGDLGVLEMGVERIREEYEIAGTLGEEKLLLIIQKQDQKLQLMC